MEQTAIEKRNISGGIASLVGIIVNLLLAAGKITLGAICGVISVLADGLNNLTDCGSSIISALSFKLAAKPADKEHPFGHERIEYICSLAVAVIILLVAFETAKESIAKIISPTSINFSYWTVGVLCASILAKFALFFYYKSTAKKIESDILRATALDSLTDCISTTVVLITILIGKFSSLNIDGYAGVLVALFIAFSAVGILKDILSKLIGQSADEQTLLAIKERILAHPEVLGVHDLSVYNYGPNKYFASAHIEVDAKVDVLVSHELVDAIEREFIEQTNIVLTGHLDPIVTDNEEVNDLRKQVETFVKEIDESFTVHDFRMVCGEKRTNVLFDVAVPYGTHLSKDFIKKELERQVMAIDDKYCLIVTVEHTVL